MKEKTQSLESQLQMAQPRRHEIKRVPLTPEEKAFLGEIMDKAVAAEKAGKLQEAINFYIDYKNELLKIKEKKEKGKSRKTEEQIRQELIEWASRFNTQPERWINEDFDLSNPPNVVYNRMLNLEGVEVDRLPENFIIHGSLSIRNTSITELPKGLYIAGGFNIYKTNIKDLPDDLLVEGKLIIDEDGPESLLNKAQELYDKKQINELEKVK